MCLAALWEETAGEGLFWGNRWVRGHFGGAGVDSSFAWCGSGGKWADQMCFVETLWGEYGTWGRKELRKDWRRKSQFEVPLADWAARSIPRFGAWLLGHTEPYTPRHILGTIHNRCVFMTEEQSYQMLWSPGAAGDIPWDRVTTTKHFPTCFGDDQSNCLAANCKFWIPQVSSH